jgi:hypothetical protein
MSAEDLRRLALALPETVEGAHHGRTDFRIGGRIFATLSPDGMEGVALLAPEEQAVLAAAEPAVFTPVPGGWGAKGATTILIAAADEPTLRSALTLAWRRKAPKRLLRE